MIGTLYPSIYALQAWFLFCSRRSLLTRIIDGLHADSLVTDQSLLCEGATLQLPRHGINFIILSQTIKVVVCQNAIVHSLLYELA